MDTGGRLPLWSCAQARSAAISQILHSLCIDLLALQKLLVWIKYEIKYVDEFIRIVVPADLKQEP